MRSQSLLTLLPLLGFFIGVQSSPIKAVRGLDRDGGENLVNVVAGTVKGVGEGKVKNEILWHNETGSRGLIGDHVRGLGGGVARKRDEYPDGQGDSCGPEPEEGGNCEDAGDGENEEGGDDAGENEDCEDDEEEGTGDGEDNNEQDGYEEDEEHGDQDDGGEDDEQGGNEDEGDNGDRLDESDASEDSNKDIEGADLSNNVQDADEPDEEPNEEWDTDRITTPEWPEDSEAGNYPDADDDADSEDDADVDDNVVCETFPQKI
jgi:hypothetical protein